MVRNWARMFGWDVVLEVWARIKGWAWVKRLNVFLGNGLKKSRLVGFKWDWV